MKLVFKMKEETAVLLQDIGLLVGRLGFGLFIALAIIIVNTGTLVQ